MNRLILLTALSLCSIAATLVVAAPTVWRNPSTCRLAYETPAFVVRECANDGTRWLRSTGGQWQNVTTPTAR